MIVIASANVCSPDGGALEGVTSAFFAGSLGDSALAAFGLGSLDLPLSFHAAKRRQRRAAAVAMFRIALGLSRVRLGAGVQQTASIGLDLHSCKSINL